MRGLLRSRRYSLPCAGACVCFFVASLVAPVFAWLLIIAAFGLLLDAGTCWLERASRTGGMHDYKQ